MTLHNFTNQYTLRSLVALIYLPWALILWSFFSLARQYWRLSHVPGPFWARFTGLWLASKFWRNEGFHEIALDLDKEYGPVVRYGPKSVLFSDPSAIPVIYGTTNAFRKAKSYESAILLVNGKPLLSLLTTRDEVRMSALKRHINSAFTTNAILDYEQHVDKTIQNLTARLKSQRSDVNLGRLITYFAFETIFRIAFSDNDINEYKMDEILEGTKTRFVHWHRWFALPDLEKLIYKNPLVTRVTPTSFLGQKATERIQQRNEEGGLGTHSDLLDRYLQAEKKAPTIFGPATITGLVISIINAGSETTSSTLNTVIFNLLYNPQAMATLRKELDSANLSFPPTYNSVAKLRYMDAAIKESLRLNLIFVEPLEREVPPGGAHIAGVFIPGGTAVAMNGHALGHNRQIWGDKPEKYRPERWLEADESQRSKMERCNLAFGAGKRICIGQHIAWIEMKKVLPALLMKFEFELVDPNSPLQKTNILIGLVQDLFVRVRGRELQGSKNHL